MTHRAHAALIAVALLATACASVNSFRGQLAASENRWDDAVALYESALRSRPNDPELLARLENARTKAFASHRRLADSALAASAYDRAVREYESALLYRDDAKTRTRLREARDLKRLADARSALLNARKLEREGDLYGARTAYRRALQLDPDYEGEVRGALASIAPRIFDADQIARQAETSLRLERYAEAEELARDALRIHAREPIALSVAQALRDERDALALEEEAERATRDGEIALAVDAARQAVALRPNARRRALVARSEQRALRFFGRRAQRSQRRRAFAEAVRLYELARSYGGVSDAYADALLDSRYALAVELAERAERECRRLDALEHYQDALEIRESKRILERKHFLTFQSPEGC